MPFTDPHRGPGDAHRAAGQPRRETVQEYTSGARAVLQPFRAFSIAAVATTALLLMIFGFSTGGARASAAATTTSPATQPASAPAGVQHYLAAPGRSVEEATGTLHELAISALELLPKIVIAAIILALAAVLAKVAKGILRRVLGQWTRTDAIAVLTGIVIFLIALGAALSVISGDVRTLVGSVGLAGLALSWALQTPIESFTGWLINSFGSYYRIGDRISVGNVFGDVYKIDILTTTVWEAGGGRQAGPGPDRRARHLPEPRSAPQQHHQLHP